MDKLSPRPASLEHQKEYELRQKLIKTLDDSLGLDDACLRGDGILLDDSRKLSVLRGADGVFGNRVTLKVDLGPDQDDFFSVNTLKKGMIQVIAARRGKGGYLVNVDELGAIDEAFASDETDMLKRKAGSPKLSPDDARAVVEGVICEFENEHTSRIALIGDSSQAIEAS